MKGLKKILILSGITIGSIAGYKIYKILRSVIDLEKTLPQYLENIFGEKPTIHLTISFRNSHLKLFFSKETIDKHDSIESTIQEYLTDFYPNINCNKLSISIVEKSGESVKNENLVEDTTEESPEEFS